MPACLNTSRCPYRLFETNSERSKKRRRIAANRALPGSRGAQVFSTLWIVLGLRIFDPQNPISVIEPHLTTDRYNPARVTIGQLLVNPR